MRKLRVAYMLPHHNITGGMKCLVEHIRLLRARGHRTIAVHRHAPASTLALVPSCCIALVAAVILLDCAADRAATSMACVMGVDGTVLCSTLQQSITGRLKVPRFIRQHCCQHCAAQCKLLTWTTICWQLSIKCA